MITEELLKSRYEILKKYHWFYTYAAKIILIALYFYSYFIKHERILDTCLLPNILIFIPYLLLSFLVFVLSKDKRLYLNSFMGHFPKLSKLFWLLNYIFCIIYIFWFDEKAELILIGSSIIFNGIYETFEYIELKMYFNAKKNPPPNTDL